MVYSHHKIGDVHINLLVVAGDLEGLQETTIKFKIFEIVLVRNENQTLLMASPCTPDHVRFKNNLTLVNEGIDATVI